MHEDGTLTLSVPTNTAVASSTTASCSRARRACVGAPGGEGVTWLRSTQVSPSARGRPGRPRPAAWRARPLFLRGVPSTWTSQTKSGSLGLFVPQILKHRQRPAPPKKNAVTLFWANNCLKFTPLPKNGQKFSLKLINLMMIFGLWRRK